MNRLAVLLGLMVGCWTDTRPSPGQPSPPPENHRVVKDIVQPVRIEKQDPNGVEGGEEGGVEGGVVGGVVGGPPPPPPPPPPPRNIPPTLLDKNRIAGDKYISPDAATVATIIADKRDTVVASLKLCVDADGDVTQVVLLKSSRYPDYDQKLATEMRAWKYRPYIVNGNAVPVCTAVTFIWSNKP